MSRIKRKPAPNALYKQGEIIAFKRETNYGVKYRVIFILDVWKVKSIRYELIIIDHWGSGWSKPRVEYLTERKLHQEWRGDDSQWEKIEHDLGFLAVHGSPATLIENIVANDKFRIDRQKRLASAKKRVERIEDEIKAIDRAQELLEKRYASTNPEST